MKEYPPKQMEALRKLCALAKRNRRIQRLESLLAYCQAWKTDQLSLEELEEKVLGVQREIQEREIAQDNKTFDLGACVASSYLRGDLKRKEIPNSLFASIEVLVEVMNL